MTILKVTDWHHFILWDLNSQLPCGYYYLTTCIQHPSPMSDVLSVSSIRDPVPEVLTMAPVSSSIYHSFVTLITCAVLWYYYSFCGTELPVFTFVVIIKFKSSSWDQTVCAVQQREKTLPVAIIIISGKQTNVLFASFTVIRMGLRIKIIVFLLNLCQKLKKHFIVNAVIIEMCKMWLSFLLLFLLLNIHKKNHIWMSHIQIKAVITLLIVVIHQLRLSILLNPCCLTLVIFYLSF